MELPIYCLIDARLVKVVAGESGEPFVLAWDWAQQDFIPRHEFLPRVFLQDDWVHELTEEEFEARLAQLREDQAGRESLGP